MLLEPIEILNGTFSLICVVISTIVGIIIASRYLTHKQKILLLVGITWIGVFSPWWPSTISFVLVLVTGKGLTLQLYFLIGLIPGAPILIIWIYAFSELTYKKYQKILVSIYTIIGIIFEVLLIYFILNDPSVIGELKGLLDVTYKSIALYYAVFIVISVLITGILFGRESLGSENPELRLKGYLLIAAFVSWSIGAILDAALPLNIITLTIARLILISSALEFYCGFLLPKFVKDLFIKQK